jgi:DNA-binding IscR family transcriptional regulator
MMEGPMQVVACAHREKGNGPVDHKSCEYNRACEIKPIMSTLNERLHDFLHRISLEELTRSPANQFMKESGNETPRLPG